MYVLAIDDDGGEYVTVYSRHRSAEAAHAAARRLLRAVRRANGATSYLRTIVCEAGSKQRLGAVRSAKLGPVVYDFD